MRFDVRYWVFIEFAVNVFFTHGCENPVPVFHMLWKTRGVKNEAQQRYVRKLFKVRLSLLYENGVFIYSLTSLKQPTLQQHLFRTYFPKTLLLFVVLPLQNNNLLATAFFIFSSGCCFSYVETRIKCFALLYLK